MTTHSEHVAMTIAEAPDWLGLRSDDWVAHVEAGLDTELVDRLIAEGALSAEEAYELIVPRRTFTRRKSRGEPLSRDESDRLARFARIMSFAEAVFGNEEKTRSWMRTPRAVLGDRTPLSLLKTDAGATAVERIIGRIAHGVYS